MYHTSIEHPCPEGSFRAPYQVIMAEKSGAKPQRLSPSQITDMFAGMSRERATNYLHKCLMNPETPTANVNLLMQYRDQNPDKFLSMEEMEERQRRPQRGLFGFGRRNDNEPKPRRIRLLRNDQDAEMLFDGMDPYRATAYIRKMVTNPDTPMENRELVQKFARENPSRFMNDEEFEYVAAERRRLNAERVQQNMPPGGYGGFDDRGNLRTGYDNGRRGWFGGRDNRDDRRGRSDQPRYGNYDNGYGRGYNDGYYGAQDLDSGRGYEQTGNERRFWSFLWKPKEEFDSMPPKEKKFFVRFYRNRTRAQNTAYGLRVMTNPDSSIEDKNAVAEVVNDHPQMFFRSRRAKGSE